jgi:arsenite methyltransferase
MPFEDDCFDMIVSNLSLNNLSDSKKLLQECHRVLKKGGKLYLTTNTVGHYREFYDAYETVLKALKKKHLLPILKKQENHRGNLESIRENLENAKFSITKILKDRFHWRYLNGSALLNHSLTIYGFLAGWRQILEGEDEAMIFEKIEAKLNEIAEEDGELKMSVPMLYLEAVK